MIIRLTLLTAFCICTTPIFAQTVRERVERKRTNERPTQNPFDDPSEPDSGFGMGAMMEMEVDMMGGMGGMGMGDELNADAKFRAGMQRAIIALKSTQDENRKEKLRDYVREALDKRYDRMMAERKKDIDRLRKRIEELENDWNRRVAAKNRVVDLQLKSAQLAAEGLLDVNEFQGGNNRNRAGGLDGGEDFAPGGGGIF